MAALLRGVRRALSKRISICFISIALADRVTAGR